MKGLLRTTLTAALAFAAFGCGDSDSTCSPVCTEKACGADDDCGGQCMGSCPNGQQCNAESLTCVTDPACTPNCTGKACGADDGCEGQCMGSCPSGQQCNAESLTCEEIPTCTPNCTEKACGADDGCEGKCVGPCSGDDRCNAETFECETSSCTAPQSLGTIPMITVPFVALTQRNGAYQLVTTLDDNPRPDALLIQLWDGFGVFADGYRTGTFNLSEELGGIMCGACVLVLSDVSDFTTNSYEDDYMAIEGTLTITSISEELLVGTLSNVTFQNFDDDCTTRIDSAAFDSAIYTP